MLGRLFCLIAFTLTLAMPVWAQFIAPVCGEFLPRTNGLPIPAPRPWVHLVPKFCNQIAINGQLQTIPAGVGVISGGLQGDTLNACIDKVCGQVLAPNTLYRVYAHMDGSMKMDFSVGGHIESQWGYHVHVNDVTRTFIGLIQTNEQSTLNGQSRSLTVASWPPQTAGRTGIVDFIGPPPDRPYLETCSPTLVVPDAKDINGNTVSKGYFVEILTFGVNAQFIQGWTMPNISIEGTALNTVPGNPVHVAVGLQRTPYDDSVPGFDTIIPGSIKVAPNSNVGAFHVTSVGGWSAAEGLIRAHVLMAAPSGGCARMPEGQIYTSPHG